MKKLISWAILGLFSLMVWQACQPPKEESQTHINLLVQHTVNVPALYEPLQKAINDTLLENIETEIQPLKKELDKQIYSIKEVKNFDDGSKYRDKVLSFLLEVLSIVEHEANELAILLHKRRDGEQLNAQEEKRLQRLPKMIAAKYSVAQEHYQQALDEFSEEYGVKPK